MLQAALGERLSGERAGCGVAIYLISEGASHFNGFEVLAVQRGRGSEVVQQVKWSLGTLFQVSGRVLPSPLLIQFG